MNVNLFNILSSVASSSESGFMKGQTEGDFAGAGVTILISILVVFVVLSVIILITYLLFLAINKTKEAIDKSDSKFARWLRHDKTNKKVDEPVSSSPTKVEILDDDMMAAVLAATIDYQNEVKTDVRVISVKEIK